MPGMIRARNGVWRPTICESSSVSRPESEAPVRIGMPKPPNATGAVFASSARAAAYSASKPNPAMREAVIATGVPKPAVASSRAPKTKAIRTTCILRSLLTPARESLMVSKWPVSTMTL
jgi:hypothetical protein